MREENIFKKRSQKNKETMKKRIKLKEMLVKAKSDEKRMKGEEDERKRATEKHKYIFFEI